MRLIGAMAYLVLAVLAFRSMRWAYVAFVLLGLLYFPARVGFQFSRHACETALDVPLALWSLTNRGHIILFAVFFVMTRVQLRGRGWSSLAWTGTITLAMGVLVELAEGVTGKGHCRLRDLVPDSAGAVLGAGLVTVWQQVRTKTGSPSSCGMRRAAE